VEKRRRTQNAAAARYAEPNPVRFISCGVDQHGAEIVSGFLCKVRWYHYAQAKFWEARVGVAKAVVRFTRPIPCRENAERFRQVLDHDLGTELVKVELGGEGWR
jgi:hypothetical protein